MEASQRYLHHTSRGLGRVPIFQRDRIRQVIQDVGRLPGREVTGRSDQRGDRALTGRINLVEGNVFDVVDRQMSVDIVSPYLIHRRPDRKKQKQAQTKDHWTQVEERYLTRAFKEAREAAGGYKELKEEEMPGFHEVQALSLHLYQKAGKDGQKIASHASETMTKNYQKNHAEIVWSEAIPDLNISEITG